MRSVYHRFEEYGTIINTVRPRPAQRRAPMSTQKRQRTESTAKTSHEAARRKWLTGMTKKDDLQIVERLLRESIHPRSTTSNDDKELELERRQSYDALCLLLCQQGRDDEATTIMRQLGHVARLISICGLLARDILLATACVLVRINHG